MFPIAVTIQRMIRGYIIRIHSSSIYQRISLLYKKRRIESRHAMVILIQRQVRRYMVYRRLAAYTEFIQRGRLNRHHAAVTIQQAIRVYIAKTKTNQLRIKRQELEYVRDVAAKRLTKYFQDLTVRIQAAKAKEARRLRKLLEQKSALILQCSYRGYLSRELLNKLRIEQATRWFAATLIQKVFRGSQVLFWRDIRLNAIAAFVLDRHVQERNLRMVNCSERYNRFIIEHRHDSASEDGEEDELIETSDWIEAYHQQSGKQYWFHSITKEKTSIEPGSSRAIDLAYVGLRVKVLWVAQSTWYEGRITRFNSRKRKYRIEYDDGDHEWMNIDKEADRILIWYQDAWIMKQLYVPVEKRAEAERNLLRMQEREVKATAWNDVRQWSVIQGDASQSSHVMYMSNKTGEIRAGSDNCLDWMVFEDDMGYPIFVNNVTGITSYEDPRFVYEISEDVQKQRDFILQEMRYVLYFCDDLLEKYHKAVENNDSHGVSKAMRALRESDKPKQLSALLIRSKSVFQKSSVLDKPLDSNTQSTLDTAERASEVLGKILSEATYVGMEEDQGRRSLLEALSLKHRQPLLCWYCRHETQRHLDFCPTCGKKQLF